MGALSERETLATNFCDDKKEMLARFSKFGCPNPFEPRIRLTLAVYSAVGPYESCFVSSADRMYKRPTR